MLIHEVVSATREQADDDAAAQWLAIVYELTATLQRTINHGSGFSECGVGEVEIFSGLVDAVTFSPRL